MNPPVTKKSTVVDLPDYLQVRTEVFHNDIELSSSAKFHWNGLSVNFAEVGS